jgi:4-oxalocrotonate tautomerase
LDGRTREQKRDAAKAITNALVEHCGAKRESVVVVFQDIPRDSWAREGVLVVDRP